MQKHQKSTRKIILLLVPKKKPKLMSKRIKEHLVFSLSTASMHGLAHIVRRNRLTFERLFWVAIVISAWVAIIMQASDIWNRYQTSPVVTVIEKDFTDWKILIPAVTICQRHLKKDFDNHMKSLISKGVLSEEDYISTTTEKWYDYYDDLFFSTYEDYGKFKKYVDGEARDLISSEHYLTAASVLVPKLTNGKVGSHYQSYNTLVTDIGLCSVYNSSIAYYFDLNKTISSNNITDYYPSYRTFSKQTDNINIQGIAQKFNVFIHSPDEIATIGTRCTASTDNDIILATLDVTVQDIVSDESIKNLTPKQRKCRFPSDIDPLIDSRVYSYNLCMMKCRKRLALKLCNCTPYYYTPLKGEPVCNMTQLYCLHVKEVMKSKECHCLPNCNSLTVDTRSIDINEQWFLFSQCRVEFNTFADVRYRRMVIFSQSDAIVQIGSLLGLYLGCSFLSIVEIFYFSVIRFLWATIGNKPIKPDV